MFLVSREGSGLFVGVSGDVGRQLVRSLETGLANHAPVRFVDRH